MEKFYITTPIYYVNDKPHLGHAYTTVAADILARYNRMKLGAENVWFLTGTDEHGIKIAQEAERRGITPQQLTDEVSAEFQLAWDHLNISNNDFIRTTEKRHEENVQYFWMKMKDVIGPSGKPVIFKGIYEGLYCNGCEAYKKDSDLDEKGQCSLHPGRELIELKEENWFFRLSDFTYTLKTKIETNELRVEPETRKNEMLGLLNEGLEDIAISRANVEWGIPLPFDESQTIYVWVDALLNYISALGYKDSSERFKSFWPNAVHLMAKDILKFHALIWPALLLAAELPLPKVVFAHGFFTIDGQKMSKSIGNVIDPVQLVVDYSSDAARHLIISQFPFGADGDIKADNFTEKYNTDLANGIGNLVSRVLGMAEKYFDAKVPQGSYTAELDLEKLWNTLDKNYKNLQVFENLQEIFKVVSWCDGYIDTTKPWELAKTDEAKLQEVIYNLLEVIRHLSYALLPYLPETAEKIWKKLGIEADKALSFEHIKVVGGLSVGQVLEKGDALFERK